MSENRTETLSVYLRYDDYLGAEQVGSALTSLSRLYDTLYAAYDPLTTYPLPAESRLRVSQAETGRSITLVLTDGIRQLLSSPEALSLQVAAGFGVVTVMGRLLISAASRVIEMRKGWHEGTQAKYEAEKAKLEVEEMKRGREERKAVERAGREATPPPYLNDQIERRAFEEALFVIMMLVYSPNITQARINGQIVIDKTNQPHR